MLVELLMVMGLVTSVQPGDPCIDALHGLRVTERMHIASTETLEDNVIAYTLTDSPRIGDKTAILICRRELADDEALEESSTDEEMALEDVGQEDDLDEADDESSLDDDEQPATE